jgi:hypothetical protein
MKFKALRLGSTGRFPFGKADEEDEGELAMAVAADVPQGIVRVLFGKPISWIGLPAGQARQLGAMLIEKAQELERSKH